MDTLENGHTPLLPRRLITLWITYVILLGRFLEIFNSIFQGILIFTSIFSWEVCRMEAESLFSGGYFFQEWCHLDQNHFLIHKWDAILSLKFACQCPIDEWTFANFSFIFRFSSSDKWKCDVIFSHLFFDTIMNL